MERERERGRERKSVLGGCADDHGRELAWAVRSHVRVVVVGVCARAWRWCVCACVVVVCARVVVGAYARVWV
jgi:hypothetical protein